MIRIPSVPQLAQTNISMPQVDPSSKIRQLQAIGDLGQSIAGLGMAYAKHAEQAQQMEDDKNISEMQLSLRTDLQKHQQDLITNGDPDKYVSSTRDFLSTRRKLLDEKPMTAVARSKAEHIFDEIAMNATLSAGDQAFRQTRSNLMKNISSEIAEAKQAGNVEDLRRAHQTLAKNGISAPQSLERDEKELQAGMTHKMLMAEAKGDPISFIASNPPSSDPAEQAKQQPYLNAARQSQVTQTASSLTNLFQSIRSGEYASAEELKDAAPQLSPDAMKVATDAYYRHLGNPMGSELSQSEINDMIGDFTNRLKSFRINQESSDKAYAELAGMLDKMPDNETRKMLQTELHQVYQDNNGAAKTREQKAYELVKNTDVKDFGYIDTNPTPLKKLMEDGFLRDSKKLAQAGLTNDQIKVVLEPSSRYDEDGNQVLIPSSDDERLAKFKEYFDPKKVSPDSPDRVRRTFDAIHRGDDHVSFLSEDQKKEIEAQNSEVKQIIGDATTRLVLFAREHPKDDLNDEYEKITMELVRRRNLFKYKK